MNNIFSKKQIFLGLALIAFGAMGRILLWDIPNVETIMVAALLGGMLLGKSWTFIVGLSAVAITDMIMGNTNILLYTWSAWAVMGVFGLVLKKRNHKPLRASLELTGMGLLGTLFFYIWTNFGVWQLSGIYPPTALGLLQSYVAALPFLKMHLLSTLIIVPTVSYAVCALKQFFATHHAHTMQPIPVRYDNK